MKYSILLVIAAAAILLLVGISFTNTKKGTLDITGFITHSYDANISHIEELPSNTTNTYKEASEFSFPDDEGYHPDSDYEWLYFDGFVSEGKNEYGIMATINHNGTAIFLISDITNKRFNSRIFSDKPDFFKENYLINSTNYRWQRLEEPFSYNVNIEKEALGINLNLFPNKQLISLNNLNSGDYFYSITDMSISGFLFVDGKKINVSGRGWMDHQWGSRLASIVTAWEWFGLKLDDRTDVMVSKVLLDKGKISEIVQIVNPDGSVERMDDFNISYIANWQSPKTNTTWPSGWRIIIPSKKTDLTVMPEFEDQELSGDIWEGPGKVEGVFNGQKANGKAFIELFWKKSEADNDVFEKMEDK